MAVINSLVYTSFFNCLHESSRNFFLFLSSMANTGITLLLLYRLTSWALAKERNPRIAWKSLGRRFMGKTLLCSFLGTTAFGTLTLQIYRTFKMSFHLNGFNILQITQFVSNWCLRLYWLCFRVYKDILSKKCFTHYLFQDIKNWNLKISWIKIETHKIWNFDYSLLCL